MASQSMSYDVTITRVNETRIIYLVTPFGPFSKFNFPVRYLSICSVSFMAFTFFFLYATNTRAVIVTEETEIFVVQSTVFFNLLFESKRCTRRKRAIFLYFIITVYTEKICATLSRKFININNLYNCRIIARLCKFYIFSNTIK